MDTRRQLKIGSVIKEAFTKILSREAKGMFGKAFITVTNVTVTSDLTLVRFYLSIYNADADEVVQKFNAHKFEFKRHLAADIRDQLRRIPEIEFFKDETQDYVERIESVFKKIDEENKELQNNLAAKQVKPKAKKAAPRKTK
jgi:ribosome-binding factor A